MNIFKVLLVFVGVILTNAAVAQSVTSSAGQLRFQPMVEDLDTPWSFGFLPDGGLLVTERGGRLWHVDAQGQRQAVSGLPKVKVIGQGGLLDVLVPRNFAQTREIFLTYSKQQGNGEGTAVARGVLSQDGARLNKLVTIFEMSPGSSGKRHFGSRIVEGRDGHLYVSIGDRAEAEAAQDTSRHNGSIVRITRNGRAASGNPFTSQPGAKPEIWSIGHRNPQGMAFDAQGRLWAVEHGAKGGDEINLIRKGVNYGWPVISYGKHYSGRTIGEGTAKDGLEQPKFYWDPSIAPSGMMIYSGKLWPEWRGHMFIGSLKSDYLSRLSGMPLRETEKIKARMTKRVRDVREGPDGAIWVLSEDRGTLYRVTPSR